MYLRVAKVRDVHLPERGHSHDAGLDFFVPQFDGSFLNRFENELPQNKGIAITPEDGITIRPGQGVLIPSGIKTEIGIGYAGLFVNKSGVASKKRLLIGAQLIDTFYSGEVHINLHNAGDEDVVLKPGDKVAQLILIPVVCTGVVEVADDRLYESLHEVETRDSGGFGSTGDKK